MVCQKNISILLLAILPVFSLEKGIANFYKNIMIYRISTMKNLIYL